MLTCVQIQFKGPSGAVDRLLKVMSASFLLVCFLI